MKIWLIIQREFYTRVRKPSFIILTILGPILMAGIFIVPVYFSMKEQKHYNVAVVDSSGITEKYTLGGAKFLHYEYLGKEALKAKQKLADGSCDVILFMPESFLHSHNPQIILRYRDKPGFIAVEKMRSDVGLMRDKIIYESFNINISLLDSLHVKGFVNVIDHHEDKNGNITTENSDVSAGIGFVGAFIMYIFIFLYGVQVMRGVMEEKTNRIVEVIVSSVRPFQLMMGKIIGVGLVGFTQFCLWIVLTSVLISVGSATVLKDLKTPDPTDHTQDPMRQMQQGANMKDVVVKSTDHKGKDNFDAAKIFDDLVGRNIYFLLFGFVFYFLGGYLLYSALFAAVGAAVDSETDAQQFMLPITIPIIFSIVMSSSVMNNPSGPLAFWLSMIPFTSPVIMMVRLPFLEFGWELILSMILLVLGFIFTTWLAGKIYRTGILMYGKKPTWRELGKWLFY